MADEVQIPDLVEGVRDRLKQTVSEIKTVEDVASLSDVMSRKIMPTLTPAAWVLDLGATGGRPDETLGHFSQPITTTIGIVIGTKASDRLGSQASRKLSPISHSVITAIAGWTPDINVTDRFRFVRERLIEVNKAAIWRQLDFTAEWTLPWSEPEYDELDDFNTGVADWGLAAPNGSAQAEDTITLEQDQ
ncbi:phage tail terminator protein [Thalassospira alkalitolerans]|uniref:phage tail terminator protein n=1 Tax=Thalassospira alkalitolerans TaxID=1293890 RepID=UPI0030ED85AF|tara:strand:+ start:12933 stop:13502 length:570 start_codon:yes stop_codon:yes gene_type:complete